MKNFVLGIVFGLGGTIGGVAGAFLAVFLFFPDNFPAPAISRVVHIDEKLSFIRRHPEIDPHILAVGSSITWRQLSGRAFQKIAGGNLHFLNGGVVELKAHETRQLAHFYLRNFRNVHTLLVLTSITDFEDCTTEREPMLDQTAARGYAFERNFSPYYYFRYFSPQRYAQTALHLPERRRQFIGDLYIDEFGSGPVKLPPGVEYGLRYGEKDVDPACIEAMVKLSRDATDRDIRLVIVFTPVHPLYRETYPEAMQALYGAVERIRSRTGGDQTAILSLIDHPRFQAEDFFDAFHLEWAGARRLTGYIVAAMENRAPPRDIQPTAPDSAPPFTSATIKKASNEPPAPR